MELFNRTLAIVLGVLLVAAGLLLVVGVAYLPGPYSLTAFDGQQFSFAPLGTTDKLLWIGGGAVLALGGVLVLGVEFLGPPARQSLPLDRPAGPAPAGMLRSSAIDRQSVERRLATVLEAIPGIRRAAIRARFQRRGTTVEAHLLTAPDAAIPPLCEQATATIEHTLRHDLGLAVGPVRLRVRLADRPAERDSATAVAS